MFCDICQKILPPGRGGEPHFSGRKHLENVAILRRREELSERSVFVTGFLPGTLEMQLTDYFSHFGAIAQIIPDKNKGMYAIIEFASKEATASVLAYSPHMLYNRRLIVKPRIIKKNVKRYLENMSRGENEDFSDLQCLRQIPTVVQQMVKLLKIVSQTEEEFRVKQQLRQKLQNIFSQYYPGCNLNIYGSSVSGYGFKQCDLDLHFKLPSDEYLGKNDTLPNLDEVKKDKNTLKDVTVNGHLRFLKRLVKKYGPSCKSILFINARCPILRFVHGNSNMPCDLSCNRGLSTYNTRLLRLYGELDSRIHLLMMTLRCWAKKRKLLGSGKHFTSYAFTLIVIFYLQTRQPPVAPSVENLANLAGEKRSVDEWDCSFCEDVAKIPKSENQEPIEILLKGFFEYFSTFDFTMNVMCLRSGSALLKTDISNTFKLNAIAVQDPFDLSHNITAAVSGQHLIYFLEKLAASFKICSGDSWGLYDILLGELPKPEILTSAVLAANCIEIPLDVDVLRTLFNTQYHTKDELTNMWLEEASETVTEILCKGLLFENISEERQNTSQNWRKRSRTESDDENPAKRQKLRGEDEGCATVEKVDESESSNSQLLHRALFRVSYQTWNGRKNESKGYVSASEFTHCLEREEYISKRVVRISPVPKEGCYRVEFECKMCRVDRGSLTLLQVLFQARKGEKEFNSMMHFLKGYIPKLVKNIFDMEAKKIQLPCFDVEAPITQLPGGNPIIF